MFKKFFKMLFDIKPKYVIQCNMTGLYLCDEKFNYHKSVYRAMEFNSLQEAKDFISSKTNMKTRHLTKVVEN